MSDYIDERTDDEILSNRATVQLYIGKLLHIFETVLGSDYQRFGVLLEAILRYARSGDDNLISKETYPITWSAFQQYKYELDSDTSKFLSKSRQNAINGHTGGKISSERYRPQANATDRKRNNPIPTHGNGSGNGNEFLEMIESEVTEDDRK